MQTGHCSLGTKCNFAHSIGELRDAELDPSFEEEVDEYEQFQEDLPLPPGLGYDEADPTMDELPDLNGLAHALEAVLIERRQVAETGVELVNDLQAPRPKASALAHDSPAYVRLSPTQGGIFSTVTCQPVKGVDRIGHLSLDSLNGLEQCPSTQSPPSSPRTPASDTGSGQSSEKTWSPASYTGNEAAMHGWYHEGFQPGFVSGAWPTASLAAGTHGFGRMVPPMAAYAADPRLAVPAFPVDYGALPSNGVY